MVNVDCFSYSEKLLPLPELVLGDSRTAGFSLLGPCCVSQWIQTWCHQNPWSKPAKTVLKKWLASGRGKLWPCARGGDAIGALSPALGLSRCGISVPAELFSSDLARRKAASCLHSARDLATYLHLWSSCSPEVNRGCFLQLVCLAGCVLSQLARAAGKMFILMEYSAQGRAWSQRLQQFSFMEGV